MKTTFTVDGDPFGWQRAGQNRRTGAVYTKSATKANRELMLTGKIRPTVKPDWDNIGKLVSDALNGIAYDDDKSVVDAVVRKYYSDRPRTQITVCEADTE